MKRRVLSILEKETREKLVKLTGKLRIDRSLGMETRSEDDNGSIEYHIENIRKASGGSWNEHVAIDYLRNLEAQVAGKSGPYLYRPSM